MFVATGAREQLLEPAPGASSPTSTSRPLLTEAHKLGTRADELNDHDRRLGGAAMTAAAPVQDVTKRYREHTAAGRRHHSSRGGHHHTACSAATAPARPR